MLRNPSTVRIRPASKADAAQLAEVFKDSWLNAYQGILPDAHLTRLVRKRDASWWQNALDGKDPMLVLEMANQIAGYATFGASRMRGRSAQGEIYELYLSPVYQGIGLGEHLFEACRHQLDDKRLKGLIVWALVDNSTACHFYWRRGGRPKLAAYEAFGDKRLEKAAFFWP